MFIPLRKTGKMFRLIGKDVHGDKKYDTTGLNFGWAPVYLRDSTQDSSVRADSSASRGRADENVVDKRIIMEKWQTPQLGDRITLDGGKPMEIKRVHERMDIVGRLHHWELDLVYG